MSESRALTPSPAPCVGSCAPPLPPASSIFTTTCPFYEVVSVPTCVFPYKQRNIFGMAWALMQLCETMGRRSGLPSTIENAFELLQTPGNRAFDHISYFYAVVSHTNCVKYWKCCKTDQFLRNNGAPLLTAPHAARAILRRQGCGEDTVHPACRCAARLWPAFPVFGVVHTSKTPYNSNS